MAQLLKLIVFYIGTYAADELAPQAISKAERWVTDWFSGVGDEDGSLVRAISRTVLEDYGAIHRAVANNACVLDYVQWAARLSKLRAMATSAGVDIAPYPQPDQQTYHASRAQCGPEQIHASAPAHMRMVAGGVIAAGAGYFLLRAIRS